MTDRANKRFTAHHLLNHTIFFRGINTGQNTAPRLQHGGPALNARDRSPRCRNNIASRPQGDRMNAAASRRRQPAGDDWRPHNPAPELGRAGGGQRGRHAVVSVGRRERRCDQTSRRPASEARCQSSRRIDGRDRQPFVQKFGDHRPVGLAMGDKARGGRPPHRPP